MVASLIATIRFQKICSAIEKGDVGAPPATVVYAFGALVTVIGVAMTVLLLRALGE